MPHPLYPLGQPVPILGGMAGPGRIVAVSESGDGYLVEYRIWVSERAKREWMSGARIAELLAHEERDRQARAA